MHKQHQRQTAIKDRCYIFIIFSFNFVLVAVVVVVAFRLIFDCSHGYLRLLHLIYCFVFDARLCDAQNR